MDANNIGNTDKKIPLIVIVGPTASGKTSLGVELALRLNGEIISADSMQIYKDMPIASAVPTEAEKKGVKHHLMEFCPAGSEFSVAEYVALAKISAVEIYNRGKTPIVVGGTGLYISSLIDNIDFSNNETNPDIRAEYEDMFDRLGGEEMLRRLKEFDADSANRLHPNNRRRIIRAFEVYRQTGTTVTEQNALSKTTPSPFNATIIGLNFSNRETLYERINKRVDIMLKEGLLSEAEKYCRLECKGSGQAIGHKEFLPYFNGECTLEDAVENLKRQTRRYAKRQLTWFLRDRRIHWIYPDTDADVLTSALMIIKDGDENGKIYAET